MDNNKKKIIESLIAHNGIVSSACNAIDMPRSTFYNWLNTDEEFKKAVDDVQEVAIDFVESKLMEKINGINMVGKGEEPIYSLPPSDTAIIFYLKTKGKRRGYVERSEIDHTTKGESINLTPIKFSKGNG